MIKCDIYNKEATKDALLKQGGWANVCEDCFNKYAAKTKGTFTTLKNIGKPGRKMYSD